MTTNSAKLAHPLSVQYGYPIGTWCTNDVLYFNDLFAYEETFNEPLTYWNTSSAISMYAMFSNARAFDQNLSHFDMSQVTQAAFMFEWATSFRGIGTENWNVGQVEVRFIIGMYCHSVSVASAITVLSLLPAFVSSLRCDYDA